MRSSLRVFYTLDYSLKISTFTLVFIDQGEKHENSKTEQDNKKQKEYSCH